MSEGLLVLDFDGVIMDTLAEDFLCVYHILRGSGLVKDMGDIGPADFPHSGVLDTQEFRHLEITRPYVRRAEDYLGFLKALATGTEIDPYRPAAMLSKEEIEEFRKGFYTVRARMKENDYDAWRSLMRIYDGMEDVMRRAVDMGWTLAIATGRGRKSTVEILGFTGLDRYISAMRARDDGMDKGEMIQSIKDELGFHRPPVFVDDSIDNLRDASEVSKPYLASWGYCTPESVEEAKREGIGVLKGPLEILGLLESQEKG